MGQGGWMLGGLQIAIVQTRWAVAHSAFGAIWSRRSLLGVFFVLQLVRPGSMVWTARHMSGIAGNRGNAAEGFYILYW